MGPTASRTEVETLFLLSPKCGGGPVQSSEQESDRTQFLNLSFSVITLSTGWRGDWRETRQERGHGHGEK